MTITNQWPPFWGMFLGEAPPDATTPWGTDPAGHMRRWVAEVAPYLPDGLTSPVGPAVVDVACGVGDQTPELKRVFETVVGVDVSPAAVDRARAEQAHTGVEFRVLDVTDKAAVEALHAELGDAVVFCRFLVHLWPDVEMKREIVAGMAALAGQDGAVVNIETTRGDVVAVEEYMRNDEAAGILGGLGVYPGQLDAGELPRLYEDTGMRVVASRVGSFDLVPDASGGAPTLPTQWVVTRR